MSKYYPRSVVCSDGATRIIPNREQHEVHVGYKVNEDGTPAQAALDVDAEQPDSDESMEASQAIQDALQAQGTPPEAPKSKRKAKGFPVPADPADPLGIFDAKE